MLTHHDIVLPNGLPLVLVPQPSAHRAVATVYFRVGSRFETQQTNGVSHFLEHMTFRGTERLPSAHDQALAFEQLGGTLYAATHVDHGVLSVSVPPSNLLPVLDLLGDVATAPLFTDMELERSIVREEILEDLDDEGREIDADNLARALMYGPHPLGFSITGGLSSLDRFDEPMLRAHHGCHYTTANAILCLAGNIGHPEQCIQAAARSFSAMPRGLRAAAAPPELAQKKPKFHFVENQSSQTDLRIAFRAPSERDPREPSVEMLLRILDDGMSTRLYERICDRRGLCYDVSGMFEAYEDDGVVDVAAGAQHARATVVVKEIFDILEELAEHGPRPDEIDKAKRRHQWSIEAMEDDAEEVAAFFGLSALAGIARTPAARHEELMAVTPQAVRDAAELVFQPNRLTVVAVGLLSAAEEHRLEKAVRGFAA
jgi:predicted Zn-dependent peptidase